MREEKLHAAIPTFDREPMLHRLVRHILRDAQGWPITVGIYDDGSAVPVRVPAAFPLPHRLVRLTPNHGKKNYWALANRIFADFQKTDADFLIYLADDLALEPGFFDQLLQAWRDLEDPRKGTLSFFYDTSRRGKSVWGRFAPVPAGPFWLTQWVDMAFLAPRSTLEALNFQVLPVDPARWDGKPFLSSGVGQQITGRLRKAGLQMYHLDRNLAHHGTHPSVMHPENSEIRKIAPLV